MTNQYHHKVKTKILDHHGIVAGICKDIGLEDEINNRIGSPDPRRIIQPGKAVIAMIIAGLGFTSRRLYLTSKFFKNKPVKRLLGGHIKAEDLDDHTLGKALDEIHEYGSTKLFAEVAFTIANKEKLLEDEELCHLDTTSFSLHGQYETEERIEVITACKGFSKDHRPDLNQVVLSLVMTGKANLPMWMEGLDGNSSDKTSFHKTVSQVREFQKQVRCNDFCWVADSAFYSADKIAAYTSFQWVSRVPESIKSAKSILNQKEFLWTDLGDGYSFSELGSNYGGINQRWLIVRSDQALKRESRTLEKRVEKEMEKASKRCWHLRNERFFCKKDAEAAVKKLEKTFRYTSLSWEIEEVRKYTRKGRPKEGDEKLLRGYEVVCQTKKNKEVIENELRRKGRFIIATNNLDTGMCSSKKTINDYRRQQNVEQGFAFLKDPWFMIDSFYVKKRSRIEALMVVMTLCLLVYNLAQYKLRYQLALEEETLPNQKGKEIQNPTMRWVFELMEGVSVLYTFDDATEKWRVLVINLNPLIQKIIHLLGGNILEIYDFADEVAGK